MTAKWSANCEQPETRMNPGSDSAGDFRPPEVEFPREAASSREAVVRFLVGELAATCGILADQIEQVVGEVFRREALGTSGIGGGLAIPHTRSEAVRDVGVLLGHLPVPLDWQAIDAEPVRLVCLVLTPRSQPGTRLRADDRLLRWLLARRDRQAG
jgi:mannitol/fructose-specific phosphotransferase system IIA component (Ntr-type)